MLIVIFFFSPVHCSSNLDIHWNVEDHAQLSIFPKDLSQHKNYWVTKAERMLGWFLCPNTGSSISVLLFMKIYLPSLKNLSEMKVQSSVFILSLA